MAEPIDTSTLGPIRIDYSREPVRDSLARIILEGQGMLPSAALHVVEMTAQHPNCVYAPLASLAYRTADLIIGRFPNVLIIPSEGMGK